jgi:hypothetical protein
MKGDSLAKETAMERRKLLQTSFATAVPVAVGEINREVAALMGNDDQASRDWGDDQFEMLLNLDFRALGGRGGRMGQQKRPAPMGGEKPGPPTNRRQSPKRRAGS